MSRGTELAARRAAAVRAAIEAIREAASTMQLVAMTCDDIASSVVAAPSAAPARCPDRATWARARAEEQRGAAQRQWARVAALETGGA